MFIHREKQLVKRSWGLKRFSGGRKETPEAFFFFQEKRIGCHDKRVFILEAHSGSNVGGDPLDLVCPCVGSVGDTCTWGYLCFYIWSMCPRCAAHISLFSTSTLALVAQEGVGEDILLLIHRCVMWQGNWSGANWQVLPAEPQAQVCPCS